MLDGEVEADLSATSEAAATTGRARPLAVGPKDRVNRQARVPLPTVPSERPEPWLELSCQTSVSAAGNEAGDDTLEGNQCQSSALIPLGLPRQRGRTEDQSRTGRQKAD